MNKSRSLGFQVHAGLQMTAGHALGQTFTGPANLGGMPTAEGLPDAQTLDRIRARVAKESTSTQLTVLEDIFSTFGF